MVYQFAFIWICMNYQHMLYVSVVDIEFSIKIICFLILWLVVVWIVWESWLIVFITCWLHMNVWSQENRHGQSYLGHWFLLFQTQECHVQDMEKVMTRFEQQGSSQVWYSMSVCEHANKYALFRWIIILTQHYVLSFLLIYWLSADALINTSHACIAHMCISLWWCCDDMFGVRWVGDKIDEKDDVVQQS